MCAFRYGIHLSVLVIWGDEVDYSFCFLKGPRWRKSLDKNYCRISNQLARPYSISFQNKYNKGLGNKRKTFPMFSIWKVVRYKPQPCSAIKSENNIIPGKTSHRSKVLPSSVLMGERPDVEVNTVLRSKTKKRMLPKREKFCSYLFNFHYFLWF
jgi:hypothetical protein